MKTKLLVVCCILMLASQAAFAMRCGNKLVRKGAHPVEVINKCGEPVYVEESVEYRSVAIDNRQAGLYRQHDVPIKIEEWTYNFGPHRFMRLLRFEDGKLLTIESIGYGYR